MLIDTSQRTDGKSVIVTDLTTSPIGMMQRISLPAILPEDQALIEFGAWQREMAQKDAERRSKLKDIGLVRGRRGR